MTAVLIQVNIADFFFPLLSPWLFSSKIGKFQYYMICNFEGNDIKITESAQNGVLKL